jgi:regulatory protein
VRDTPWGSGEAGRSSDDGLAPVSYLSDARPASRRRRAEAPSSDGVVRDDASRTDLPTHADPTAAEGPPETEPLNPEPVNPEPVTSAPTRSVPAPSVPTPSAPILSVPTTSEPALADAGARRAEGQNEPQRDGDGWIVDDVPAASGPRFRAAAPVESAVVTSISGIPLGGETPDNEPEAVDRAVVEQRVLRALGRKALSEKEVRALIADNGLDGPEADEIVERLIELRYVDDGVLAEELTRRLSEKKGQSKSAVGRSLAARGLPSDVVSEALSEIDDGEERRVAFEIAEKRARQMGSLDAQTLERRLSGFLARRGYPGGLVRDIVSEIARRRPSAPSGPRFR